jgi:protein phosphatase
VNVTIPKPALVLLVGPSGSGKSTFAHKHFKRSEIISSDLLREMISDDPSNQDASAEAFRVLALLANGRLKRRLTTVIDATNLRHANRRSFRQLASRYGVPVVAVAFDYSPDSYRAHNRRRPDRNVDDDVVDDQASRMREALAALPVEDYAAVYVLRDPATAGEVTVTR